MPRSPLAVRHLSRILVGLVAVGAATSSAAASTATPGPRSSYIVVPADMAQSSSDADAPTLVYLNHKGGSFRPGGEDAYANTSSILKRAATIPAWNVKADRWNKVVSCVDGMLARWDVEVTDVDPGNVPHYEVVIGGEPSDAGLDAGIAGIAPFSGACRSLPTAVAFAFAEVVDSDDRIVCEVAVHEFAHTIGLDHEYLCKDPMSYLHGCGDKTFQPVDAPCGEGSARACTCGGTTQNSVGLLDARLGLAGVGNTAPTVAVASPVDGARLRPGFQVTATAADNAAVDEVQLWIDGALAATAESAPYTFTTRSLSDGVHTVEVRAIDAASKVTVKKLSVTVDAHLGETASIASSDDASSTGGCDAGAAGSLAPSLGVLALALRRRRR